MEKALIEALIQFISFKGIHAKVVNELIAPHQDYGQKLIDFLTDSDTVIFALSQAGELFLMNQAGSFVDAWRRGIRFEFAFSLPKEFWQEQVETKSQFFNETQQEFSS